MKIHTVLFDLDGTLSNSSILTVAAFDVIAPQFGLTPPTLEAIQRATGYSNPEFYFRLFPDIPQDKIAHMGSLIEQEELRILSSMSHMLLFPGCLELLNELRSRGIRLYIASTGATDHVYPILRETGIQDYFERIVCHRPDKTDMLREMTKDLDKDGCLMVGDMKKDYEAARANGIMSVGACFGYCRREFTDFDIYIDTPFELLRFIS